MDEDQFGVHERKCGRKLRVWRRSAGCVPGEGPTRQLGHQAGHKRCVRKLKAALAHRALEIRRPRHEANDDNAAEVHRQSPILAPISAHSVVLDHAIALLSPQAREWGRTRSAALPLR